LLLIGPPMGCAWLSQSWTSLFCLSHDEIRSPVGLNARSVRLENFIALPTCIPSRSQTQPMFLERVSSNVPVELNTTLCHFSSPKASLLIFSPVASSRRAVPLSSSKMTIRDPSLLHPANPLLGTSTRRLTGFRALSHMRKNRALLILQSVNIRLFSSV